MFPSDPRTESELAEVVGQFASGEPRELVVLTADLVGYSGIVNRNVQTGITVLRETRSILTRCIRRCGGKTLQTPGDFVLAAFEDFASALKAAVLAQERLLKRNQASTAGNAGHWKIGIALGEVHTVEDEYYGNAINVAARLQALANPGEIYFTGAPDNLQTSDDVIIHDLGPKTLKNIDQAVHIHRAVIPAYDMLMQTAQPGFTTPPVLLRHIPKPVIRLEPFRSLNQKRKNRVFGEALVGEIQLILSRLSNSILVIDPRRSGTGKHDYILSRTGKHDDILSGTGKHDDMLSGTGKHDYVLSGTVQSGGSYIRIMWRLDRIILRLNTIVGRLERREDRVTVLQDRFDCNLDRSFDQQDQIAQEIVAALQIGLTEGEPVQLSPRSRSSGKAWEYFQRAHDFERRFTRRGHEKAREHYGEALRVDQNYLSALVALGLCHLDEVRLGWSKNEAESIAAAEKLCGRAKLQTVHHAEVSALSAYLYFFKKKWDEAREEMQNSVRLAPQNPEIIGYQGALYDLMGDYSSAIRAYNNALGLSAHPSVWIYSNLGLSYLALGNNTEAEHIYLEVLESYPEYERALIGLAVSLNRQGKTAEAIRAAEKVLSLDPRFSAAEWARPKPFNDERLLSAFVRDLREVGIP